MLHMVRKFILTLNAHVAQERNTNSDVEENKKLKNEVMTMSDLIFYVIKIASEFLFTYIVT